MSSSAAAASSNPTADGFVGGDQQPRRDSADGADKVVPDVVTLGDPKTSSPPPGLEDEVLGAKRGANRGFGSGEFDANRESESEAETVRLNGDELAARRIKGKAIKREDDSDGILARDDESSDRDLQMDADMPNGEGSVRSSGLGKRKRARHPNRDIFVQDAGNSSSVLSSPGATTHSSKKSRSDSERSLSSPPHIQSKDQEKPSKPDSRKRKARDGDSDDEIVPKRSASGTSRRQHSPRVSAQSSNAKNHTNRHGNNHNSSAKDRRETRSATAPHHHQQPSTDRSPSPPSHSHRRTASSHSISQLANGHSHKKRKSTRPPPLVTPRDRRYSDAVHSDSSSASGSSRRQGRVKKNYSPADEMNVSSMAQSKMNHKKRRDQIGRTHLARACASGDIKNVNIQLNERPEDKDLPDNAGNTPLQIASLEGHADVVEILLQAGCDPNCFNNDKDTPLIDAVENSNLDVIKMLLRHGANPKQQNIRGADALECLKADQEYYREIKYELENVVEGKSLVTVRASEDHSGHDDWKESRRSSREASAGSPTTEVPTGRYSRRGRTRNDLLWLAPTKENLRDYAGRGDMSIVGHILSIKPEADTETLIAAARAGHDEILQLLLGMGNPNADPEPLQSSKYPDGYNTPMLSAIGRGNTKVVDLLLAQAEFNPTRRWNGRTYYELSEERRGDCWKEEQKLLKKAYDRYMAEHQENIGQPLKSSSSRSAKAEEGELRRNNRAEATPSKPADLSSGRTKRNMESEPRRPARVEATSSSNPRKSDGNIRRESTKEEKRENTGLARSGFGKEKHGEASTYKKALRGEGPREGSVAISDRESTPLGPPKSLPHKSKLNDSDAAPATSEGEVSKPRRKLVSGKVLKGNQERRASVASSASSSSIKDKPRRRDSITANDCMEPIRPERDRKENKPENRIEADKPSNKNEKAGATDSSSSRTKLISAKEASLRREQSGDRLGVIRRESNLKRSRSSVSPPRSRSRDSETRKDHGDESNIKRRRVESDRGKTSSDLKEVNHTRNGDSHRPQTKSKDNSAPLNNGERKKAADSRTDVHSEAGKGKVTSENRPRARGEDDKTNRDKAGDPVKKSHVKLDSRTQPPKTGKEVERPARKMKEDRDEMRKLKADGRVSPVQEKIVMKEAKKKVEDDLSVKKAEEEEEQELKQAKSKEALKKKLEEEAKQKKAMEEEEARKKVKEEEQLKKAKEEEEIRKKVEDEERKKAEEREEALRKAREEEEGKEKERLRIQQHDYLKQQKLREELGHIISRAQHDSLFDRKLVEGEHERQVRAEKELERIAEKKRREEEAERRRAEAEKRLKDEAERRRREALPPALCEAARMPVVQAKSHAEVQKWLPLYYAEFPPSCPNIQPDTVAFTTTLKKEKWILNLQAAPILGVHDLELPQYTAWHTQETVISERVRAWEVLGVLLTGAVPRGTNPADAHKYHMDGQKKFFDIERIFWIKLSDFLDTVDRHPHLAGVDMRTQLMEFEEEEDYIIPNEAGIPSTSKQSTDTGSDLSITPQVNGCVPSNLNCSSPTPFRSA